MQKRSSTPAGHFYVLWLHTIALCYANSIDVRLAMPIWLFAIVHDLRSNWHVQRGTDRSACAAGKLARQGKPFFEYVPSSSHGPMMRRVSRSEHISATTDCRP